VLPAARLSGAAPLQNAGETPKTRSGGTWVASHRDGGRGALICGVGLG